MSFHVLAYYKNVPTGTTFIELLPVTDALVPINPATNHFYSSRNLAIFSAWSGGTSLSRARVYTPWKLPNEIRPISNSALPTPALSALWLDIPMRVPPTHDIIVDAVHTNGASQDVFAVLLATDTAGLTPLPPKPRVLNIRGDIAGAAPTARQWSEVSVTWEYNLTPGTYAIIGSECISSNAVAHRWILEHTPFRPGALATTLNTVLPSLYQMYGATGDWGRFTAPLMPRLEVLCNAADATMTAFLQVVQL